MKEHPSPHNPSLSNLNFFFFMTFSEITAFETNLIFACIRNLKHVLIVIFNCHRMFPLKISLSCDFLKGKNFILKQIIYNIHIYLYITQLL